MKEALNRQVDIYVNLCTQLIGDDPLKTTSSKNLSRDIKTVRSRCQHEGLSFITKRLPVLGRALDVALVGNRFSTPSGFRNQKGWSTPALLQAYFNLVFDEDGYLRENAHVGAIKHLRQVCFFAYKLEIPHSKEEEDDVVTNFVQTDKDLALLDLEEHVDLINVAASITSIVFKDFDPLDILPRHGPGAVATGERLEAKWAFAHKYSELHRVYPYYEFFIVGKSRELSDRLDWYKRLEVHEYGTAKVVLVPKDSRGPRLISCEPLEYQYIQQGLGRKMADHLESHWLTKGQVNFTHQEINRKLAMVGSSHHYWGTLDLKDASDRVSLELVRRVFKRSPSLLRALEASRSRATLLPNGSILPLNKFAPMGSALCFPVEAYIFWVLQVARLVLDTNLPLNRVGKKIFVYGDDIVIPRTWALRCIQALESCGLLVNMDKSCITGSFRESCGLDAFLGVEVTPLRLKKQWTGRSMDGTGLASYASLANRLGERGYPETSRYLWNQIERTYGAMPHGLRTSGFPCHWDSSHDKAISFNTNHFRWRRNPDYQRLEFSVKLVSSRRRKTRLNGWPRLLRDMVSPVVGDPSSVVLPRSTLIKREWAAV